jgi:hypothetical protein
VRKNAQPERSRKHDRHGCGKPRLSGSYDFHVWERIMADEGLDKSNLFTLERNPARCIGYVNEKVFAIDFDERAVRVGRAIVTITSLRRLDDFYCFPIQKRQTVLTHSKFCSVIMF